MKLREALRIEMESLAPLFLLVWLTVFSSFAETLKILLTQSTAQIVCARSKSSITTSLHFKREGDGSESGGSSDGGGWIQRIARFINPVQKARLEKSYEQTQNELGYRYMLRLIQPKSSERRHCITRLMRFLPDLTFETAGEIVDAATSEGVGLIRVYNRYGP